MSQQIIKACVDRILPANLLIEAAKKAVEEAPANAPIVAPGFGVTPPRPEEIAVLTGKKWENGRTLQVRFLDGESSVQAKVEQYAHQWSQYANIKFEFGSATDAEIRISFQPPGSWSFIGTDCLSIGKSDPTMNFGWLTPTTANDEYSRVVLHEVGHALGCIHEHQNPTAGIHWNKEAVYRYYMGPPNNWTKEQVDTNLFQKYSRDLTQFTKFDPTSIMEYPIPMEFITDGTPIGWNRDLSAMDQAFLGKLYPFDLQPTTELTIGASPTEASIGMRGEEDLYRFVIANEGRYTLETQGGTDVVMALFGPNTQTHLIAADDDSGRANNAKIVTTLKPATYYVRVRHYQKSGTGKYKISVWA